MTRRNDLGQSVGAPVDWSPVEPPAREPMEGRWCSVQPLDPGRHAADLHTANSADEQGEMWTYMPYGPFGSEAEYREWCVAVSGSDDPLFHAVVVDGRALGVASYLRIEPSVGVIEVGHIAYAPELQQSTAATEAMYLMARRAFDELGYRRYEWKCDALNEPSRRAADRLGFTFEGVFRQATMYKGRNRDTAWYSIIDSEWPAIRPEYERWLDPGNFDEAGRQLTPLRVRVVPG